MAKKKGRITLRVKRGGAVHLLWLKLHKKKPGAPQPPIKKPAKHHPLPLAHRIVSYANTGLHYAGRMYYSESGTRSQLFHRAPGDFDRAHADCSQFAASILHWCGIHSVTDTDYTGTLLQKGHHHTDPAPGRVVIFGAAPGVHAAIITEKINGAWYAVGFGHQGAPDRVALTNLEAYFKSAGHPGVTFLEFG